MLGYYRVTCVWLKGASGEYFLYHKDSFVTFLWRIEMSLIYCVSVCIRLMFWWRINTLIMSILNIQCYLYWLIMIVVYMMYIFLAHPTAFSVNISLYWFGYFISLCLHYSIKMLNKISCEDELKCRPSLTRLCGFRLLHNWSLKVWGETRILVLSRILTDSFPFILIGFNNSLWAGAIIIPESSELPWQQLADVRQENK